jgi:TRAP-type C4-dicarboxylate transport system substrate-binding protein
MPSTPQIAIAAACCAAALSGGCGGAPADKTGGAARDGAKVLTLANGDTGTRDIGSFADAVEKASGGRLVLRIRANVHAGDVDYERKLIDDVRTGRFDMAKVGARAWDLAGVRTFAPLVAPLAITSMDQQQRVLRSPLAGEILAGVRPLGLEGIALLPGELRYPIGITRVVSGARDFRGAIAAMRPSRTTAASFAALGARGRAVVAGGDLDGYDIAELDMGTLGNSDGVYDAQSVTADLPLWPRTQSIVMAGKVFGELTEEQREWLADAATAALAPAVDAQADFSSGGTEFVCAREGFALVQMGRDQVAAVERATEPVRAAIGRDAAAGRILDGILGTRGTPDTLKCPDRPAPPARRVSRAASPLDGVWNSDVTRSRYFAAHPDPNEDNEANWGKQTLRLDHGRFVITNARFPGEVGAFGVFEVEGDQIRFFPGGVPSHGGGETWTYGWSRFRDVMRLERTVSRRNPTALVAAPWTKSD